MAALLALRIRDWVEHAWCFVIRRREGGGGGKPYKNEYPIYKYSQIGVEITSGDGPLHLQCPSHRSYPLLPLFPMSLQ